MSMLLDGEGCLVSPKDLVLASHASLDMSDQADSER
jgi:hypothetical protein